MLKKRKNGIISSIGMYRRRKSKGKRKELSRI